MKHESLFHGVENSVLGEKSLDTQPVEILNDTEARTSDCEVVVETTFTACLELSAERVNLELQIEEQRRMERLRELEALRERAKAD